MSARDEVLARIRSALGDQHGAEVEVSRAYRRDGGDAVADLLVLLDERLTDYRARVRRASSDGIPDAVAEAVADGLPSRPDTTGSPARLVVPSGLPDAWTSAVGGDVVTDEDLAIDALDDCDGVITAAAVAIAETGTIVLDGSPDQGRRAITLVPDLHVCVVRADQVVASVPEGVARLDPTRPLTWISGPSATSDIELNRVEGVHGPRTLEVVLVSS
jgi:L-lactate dehydrogenase complex protein LldG